MKRCDGVTRRNFLRIGGLSALGLGLGDALRARAAAGASGKPPNCILIWLDGGPSHLDMFDLKPDAPAEVRGDFKPMPTKVPGVAICEHFRKLAGHTDKLCIIRSMTSELGEHNFGSHYLLTGYKPSPVLDYPSFGSVTAALRGAGKVLPPYVAVPDYNAQAGAGYLPASARPFAVGGDPARTDFRVRDLDITLPAERLERRREFVADIDRLSRNVETKAAAASRDAGFDQAYRLILSPQAKAAFDLSQEKHPVRAKYGLHKLGQSCLLARRLVEAGCPFVTVNDVGWDTHANIARELKEGYVGGYAGRIPKLDEALSALLEDLSARGLLSETLVVVMGEFGRTPKLNTAGGRDHWPRAFSVVLAGAGIKAGQVVGSSDSRGESAHDRPVTPADLAKTIYTVLGIDPDHEFLTADGRPVKVAAGGDVVREVIA